MREQEDLINEMKSRMQKSVYSFTEELSLIRAGKPNPAIISKIKVTTYGGNLFINQLANIYVSDSHTLIVEPWDKNTIKDIKKSIESSELNKIFDLKIINWDRCLLESSSNLLKEVCKLRSKSNNSLGSKEIAKKFMISSATVVRYLNIGNTLGLCRYNGKEEVTKNLDNKRDIISNKNKKKVICKESLTVYESCTFLAKLINVERGTLNAKLTGKNHNNTYYQYLEDFLKENSDFDISLFTYYLESIH